MNRDFEYLRMLAAIHPILKNKELPAHMKPMPLSVQMNVSICADCAESHAGMGKATKMASTSERPFLVHTMLDLRSYQILT